MNICYYGNYKRQNLYRFDGPSPTTVSRIAPQKVRCGGRIARGNLPGVTPAE